MQSKVRYSGDRRGGYSALIGRKAWAYSYTIGTGPDLGRRLVADNLLANHRTGSDRHRGIWQDLLFTLTPPIVGESRVWHWREIDTALWDRRGKNIGPDVLGKALAGGAAPRCPLSDRGRLLHLPKRTWWPKTAAAKQKRLMGAKNKDRTPAVSEDRAALLDPLREAAGRWFRAEW